MRGSLSMLVAAAFACAFSGSVRADSTRDAQAILDKAIKAMGGEKVLEKHQTVTWSSDGTYYGMGGDGVQFVGRYATQLPDKYRFEVPNFMTIVVDGNHGWVQANGETNAMNKEQLANAQEELYQDRVTLLLPLKQKGFTLTSLGGGKAGGYSVVGLKVTHIGHPPIFLFFDTKNFLLRAVESHVKSQEEQNKEVIQRVVYSEYKKFDGVPFPTKFIITRDGNKYVTGTNDDVKFSKELPAKTFEKP